MTDEARRVAMGHAKRIIPGGAPDQETADLMHRLSDLQTWCALMARKDSGGSEAARLVQDARAFIVERLYPQARTRPSRPHHPTGD